MLLQIHSFAYAQIIPMKGKLTAYYSIQIEFKFRETRNVIDSYFFYFYFTINVAKVIYTTLQICKKHYYAAALPFPYLYWLHTI